MAASPICKSAPPDLVDLYTRKQVAKGAKVLKLLLTHADMELAWRELARHASNKDHATRLFSELVFILHTLRRHVILRRSEERDEYLAIAEQAERLASSIENGPLDKLAFENFPGEVMHINGIAEWEKQNGLERSTHAHELLRAWPSVTDMLRELANQANALANEAMTKPRVVERRRGAVDPDADRNLHFVRELARYIKREYGSSLYDVVAHMSNAILGTGFSKREIKRMIEEASAKTT
jgi:hypothetical protein